MGNVVDQVLKTKCSTSAVGAAVGMTNGGVVTATVPTATRPKTSQ